MPTASAAEPDAMAIAQAGQPPISVGRARLLRVLMRNRRRRRRAHWASGTGSRRRTATTGAGRWSGRAPSTPSVRGSASKRFRGAVSRPPPSAASSYVPVVDARRDPGPVPRCRRHMSAAARTRAPTGEVDPPDGVEQLNPRAPSKVVLACPACRLPCTSRSPFWGWSMSGVRTML
jgi:hypothetical protein